MIDELQAIAEFVKLARRVEILEHTEVPTVGGGGGAIGGAIAATQVAYGTAADTIGGGADFTYTAAAKTVNIDNAQWDLTPAPAGPVEGLMYWNASDGTLNLGMAGGNVNLQIGQEMLLRVYNDSGANIVNGDVVYISGGSGSQACITRADPDSVTTAAAIGMATENIDDKKHGYVTTRGLVRGDAVQTIDTSAYAPGTILWLTDNGKFTSVKATAPRFSVVVGVVVRRHATAGVIYTNIDIVPRLQSLSDVLVSGIASGDLLQWDAGDARWENKAVALAIAHNLLSATHSDTTPAAAVRGDVITGQAGPVWARLALGNSGEFVGSDGTDARYLGATQLNGFVNRADSSLAMSGANLRIAPTGAGFAFYSAGVRHYKTTNQDAAITTDLTQHFVYFDTAGAVQVLVGSIWSITSDNVPAAIVYKDGGNYAILDERHGYRRNRDWHAWAHDTIGARYESGLAGTFTDTTFSIAHGVIHDEDIELDTGGTKTSCRLWYRNAAATAMRFESAITRPWKLGATPAPQYDSAGTLTDVTANRYFCSYVYCTNDIDYPIYIVVGQAQYTTVASARNDPLPATPGQITREWKLLYRVIYQRNGASATYIEATDYREVSTGPGSTYTPASHTALTNRDAAGSHPATAISNTPAGTIAATEVQAAINELDTEKVPTTRTISTTAPLSGGGDLSADRTLTVGAASESAAGVVELATVTEAKAGTDTTRAVTPAGVAGIITLATPASDGKVIKSGAGVLTLSAAGAYTLTVPDSITALGRSNNIDDTRILFGSDANTADASGDLTWAAAVLGVTGDVDATRFIAGSGSGAGRLDVGTILGDGLFPAVIRTYADASAGPSLLLMYTSDTTMTGQMFARQISSVNTLGLIAGSGFQFIAAANNSYTDPHLLIKTDGKTGVGQIAPAARLHVTEQTGTTNAILEIARLEARVTSTGVGAAGFGPALTLFAESATNVSYRQQAQLAAVWATATDASRKARSVWSVWDTAEREGVRIEASGSAPLVGFLGAAAVARAAHIADPSGGATTDAEARTAINAILVVLENLGFVATA